MLKVEQLSSTLLFSIWFLYISHLLSSIFVMAHDRQSVVKALARLKRPWISPYRKFGFTAPMFNVCTLHYYQKRELCRTIFSLDMFDFQFTNTDYPDLSCKNIDVDLSPIIKGRSYEQVAVSAYKCPFAYKVDVAFKSDQMSHMKTFIPVRLYISGSVYKNSAVLYYQHESPIRKRIKAYLVAFEVPVVSLSFMVLDRRNMVWERSMEHLKSFHERKVRRRIEMDGNLLRDPWETESALGGSEAIKRLPLMAKFEHTYKVRNLCGLKRKEKVQFCMRAFQNTVYSTLINGSGRFVCRRRKAVYNFTFAARLGSTPTIFALQCPTWRWTTSYSFNLATHLGDYASLAFIQINPFPDLLPDAVLYHDDPGQIGSDSDANV